MTAEMRVIALGVHVGAELGQRQRGSARRAGGGDADVLHELPALPAGISCTGRTSTSTTSGVFVGIVVT